MHLRTALGSIGLLASLALAVVPATQPAATAPATQPFDVSLQILGVRLNHTSKELSQAFGSRLQSELPPGISVQMLMTAKGQTFLPIDRNAVNLETAVDDTFQSLLPAPGETPPVPNYGPNYPSAPAVSEDGSMIAFAVQATKLPDPAAERVFVRGTVTARLADATPKTASAALAVKVGSEVKVGPINVSMSGVKDLDHRGRLVANLMLRSDGPYLQRVRVLGSNGDVINDHPQIIDRMADTERTDMYTDIAMPPETQSITIECTTLTSVRTVRIPFAAQVDIGATQAGPPATVTAQAKADPTTGKPLRRTWSPPPAPPAGLPKGLTDFGARRPMIAPPNSVLTKQPMAVDRPTIDLFALTLGKSGPGDSPAGVWQNVPAASIQPRGYTIARLLLSVPNANILSIKQDGILLTRFGDDKTSQMPATLLASSPVARYGQNDNIAIISADGQQALFNLMTDAGLTTGATRLEMEGSVKALVGRDLKSVTVDHVPFKGKGKTQIGPFTITSILSYLPTPATPENVTDQLGYSVNIRVEGPADQLLSFEFPTLSKKMHAATRIGIDGADAGRGMATIHLFLNDPPGDDEPIIAHYFDKVETVTLPFSVKSGVGL